MYKKVVFTAGVALALIALAVPTSADLETNETSYVGGHFTGEAGGAAVCDQDTGAGLGIGIGGGCVSCPAEDCVVTVEDDVLGPMGFNWRCGDSTAGTSPADSGDTITQDCTGGTIRVFVHGPSVAGTISAS